MSSLLKDSHNFIKHPFMGWRTAILVINAFLIANGKFDLSLKSSIVERALLYINIVLSKRNVRIVFGIENKLRKQDKIFYGFCQRANLGFNVKSCCIFTVKSVAHSSISMTVLESTESRPFSRDSAAASYICTYSYGGTSCCYDSSFSA